MTQPFSLSTKQCKVLTDPTLRAEILTHTASSQATEQILSALLRFGVDPTIERFDVLPQQNRGGTRVAALAWTVKAIRAARPDAEAPTPAPIA